MNEYSYHIHGLDCPNCAKKIEDGINASEKVSSAHIHYDENTLHVHTEMGKEEALEHVQACITAIEDGVTIHELHDEHHHHTHDHDHHEDHHKEGKYQYHIEGLDCANCAQKLEDALNEIDGVHNARIRFMTSHLSFDCKEDDLQVLEEEIRRITKEREPDVTITKIDTSAYQTYRYEIKNIDCADCAAELEHHISKIEGIANVKIDFLRSQLVYACLPTQARRIEQEMRNIVAKEEPDVTVTRIERNHIEKEEDHEHQTMLYRLIGGAILFCIGLFLKDTAQVIISLLAYVVLGYDILLKAIRNIGKGQLFDEHFLMSVATLAAIYLKDYREAAAVMLFYQIGEYFQDRAVAHSRKSIGELMDIRPDYAFVKENEEWTKVHPEEVNIGEIILVKPGERIPLDGIVVSGASSLDTSSLTGESKLKDVDINDEVYSGAINTNGVLEVKVTKGYGDSTVSRILELVENTDSNKAKAENFITKFSRVYTPTVVFLAILVCIVVSLFMHDVREGIERACTFLVISCPCALVISIPLSFFAGIGGLSKKGILVKGANIIESLSELKQIVLDKTGTLTKGTFVVDEICPINVSSEQLLEDAYLAESFSNHPISSGLKKAYGKEIDQSKIKDTKEIAGRGTQITYEDHVICAGNAKLMQDIGIKDIPSEIEGTVVHVAKDGIYEGYILLEDELKDDAKQTIQQLHREGKKCFIVSGDNQSLIDRVKDTLQVDEAYGECMPEDKVNYVKTWKEKGLTGFVGDGVNDAPVLAQADVGFAMGAVGSDAAIEAADVVIMDDVTSKVSLAIAQATNILKVVKENIYGAILIKVFTLILGAFGIANMWMAIFADTGVAILCVLNAMRLLKIRI